MAYTIDLDKIQAYFQRQGRLVKLLLPTPGEQELIVDIYDLQFCLSLFPSEAVVDISVLQRTKPNGPLISGVHLEEVESVGIRQLAAPKGASKTECLEVRTKSGVIARVLVEGLLTVLTPKKR